MEAQMAADLSARMAFVRAEHAREVQALQADIDKRAKAADRKPRPTKRYTPLMEAFYPFLRRPRK
jgi:hypothetical protein